MLTDPSWSSKAPVMILSRKMLKRVGETYAAKSGRGRGLNFVFDYRIGVWVLDIIQFTINMPDFGSSSKSEYSLVSCLSFTWTKKVAYHFRIMDFIVSVSATIHSESLPTKRYLFSIILYTRPFCFLMARQSTDTLK